MTNKVIKRLGAGAIAITSAFALAACGTSNSTTTTTSTTDTATSAPSTSADPLAGLTSSTDPITLLFGSSGDAETAAVKAAAAAWSAQSGIQVTVTPADNLDQQLAQGFASGSPADVFYLSPGSLPGYADAGNLLAYGDLLPNKGDFYQNLLNDYTYKGQLYAAPKDFSTLALVINDDMWTAAGLTAADYPTTWDQLQTVAKKLTTGNVVGLCVGAQYERLGALMVANGANLMNADQTQATANAQSNIDALTFAQSMLKDGSMKFAADVQNAGWGGECFGKGNAAMTIEGNWITGAMTSDYSNIKYTAVALPKAPSGGQGTMEFSNGWGIAKDSKNQKAAVQLVEYMTTVTQQMAFSQAFGIMPSLQTASSQYAAAFPAMKAFSDGAAYAQGVPTIKGASQVITDLDNQLPTLATTDPKTILDSTQSELQALL